ncbi:MAG: alkaline phosphatase family protein [Blastocatellia bacterium]|nr:alkaline phosphatase family protein [Blastocatellia bacterium]MBN8724267.1 alkaline phosphatase family protein [Acidobacteriota bacterium]
MSKKILIIGLDGTTFNFIDPLIAKGRLPVLAKLMKEGIRSPLETIFPPITSAAWTSFITGKNPGKHGIFEFIQRRQGQARETAANATQRSGKALWDLFSEEKRPAISTNFPVTYPPSPINGVMISDFMTPRGRRDIAQPASVLAELEAKFGPYKLYMTETYARGNVDNVLKELHEELDYKSKVNCYLMQNYDWQMFVTHIWGTDRCQHELWHIFDDTHPRHDKEEAKLYRERIYDYWDTVDREVGNMLSAAGDDTAIFIASDHGFGPAYTYCAFNIWLMQEGFLKLKPDAFTRLKKLMFSLGLTPEFAYTLLRNPLLKSLRPSRGVGTQKSKVGLINKFFLSFNDVDWSKTTAFSKGNYGQIFVNLKGREIDGSVSQGEEYERVRNQVIEKLRQIKDPKTGGKLIGQIYKREETFSGEHLTDAPDICFLPEDMSYVSLGSLDFMSNRFMVKSFGNSGTHRLHGVLIAKAKELKSGLTLPNAHITDAAPTILHLANLPVPPDMDGKVLSEIFTDEFLRNNPVRIGKEASRGQVAAAEFSDEESEEVRARLHELGYMG